MEETRLIQQIQGGSCVLFLGAGASISSGGPTAEELADELAQNFFDDKSKKFTLGQVCEYVESNLSRKDLEDYLVSRLGSLSPQGESKLVMEDYGPKLTNYSLCIFYRLNRTYLLPLFLS